MNRRLLIWGSVFTTAVMELVTVGCHIGFGQSAAEFNATDPPLLLQMHHMFWSLPFILIGIVGQVRGWRVEWAWMLVIGLIASDLMHHFIVLPLWVGNTGWHWP